MSVKKYLAALAATALIVGAFTAQANDRQPIAIGTGGVTGVYYPAGGAICRLVNKQRKKHGIRCSVESTDGSVYNLDAIRVGELDIGVVQSDSLYHAYNGTREFANKAANKQLRAIFSIHAEPLTVLARADSGIKHLQDLKGKRVNVGNPGSGQRGTMEVLMKALGWKMSDFSVASELKSSEQANAMCDDKVDAIIFTVGHPNGSIKQATTACDSNLVNVTGAAVDKLIADNSYYRPATIPAGMYVGNDKDINTFGVGATIVTSTDMPDEVIYIVVKSVFEDMKTFKNLHPAFNNLDPKQMIKHALSAPLHGGAVKYYKEVGLM